MKSIINLLLQHQRRGGWSSLTTGWPIQARAMSSKASKEASAREERYRSSAAEIGMYLTAAAIGMVGFSYASVPLYKLFCTASGYGGFGGYGLSVLPTVEGKLKRRQENPDTTVERAAAQREITVWFDSHVADDMPWEFKPTQEFVKVKPGQSTLIFFNAKNKSDKSVTGYSVYNISPDKAAVYFNKIQCFCFEEQRLRGNEQVDMPVFFYLDPEMATDWNCRNIEDVTLSYTFHKMTNDDCLNEEDEDAPTQIKLHGQGNYSGLQA